MTEQAFRRMALGLTEAIEGAHMGHPDFRVNEDKYHKNVTCLFQRVLRPAIFNGAFTAGGTSNKRQEREVMCQKSGHGL